MKLNRYWYLAGCFVFCLSAAAQKQGWIPVTAQDLSLREVPGNPGAPAIQLYYSQNINDHDENNEGEYIYRRIKILSEKGKSYADVEIRIPDGFKLSELKARTVDGDGKPTDFTGKPFDKIVAKGRGFKYLAKAFTFPDVTVGTILEYRYKLNYPANVLPPHEWVVQHDLYTVKEEFGIQAYVGPIRGIDGLVGLSLFQTLPRNAKIQRKGEGFTLQMENVPAFEAEPYMPPQVSYLYHVTMAYGGREMTSPEKFWHDAGLQWNQDAETFIGDFKDIKSAAAEATGDEPDAEKKLHRLYERAQQVRNLSYERERTEDELKKESLKSNQNVADVLNRGYGTRTEITRLFVALARAAGFESSILRTSNRSERFFDLNLLYSDQLDTEIALVALNGKDLYLDPGTRFCPFGLLRWVRTSTRALKLDKKGGSFVEVPMAPHNMAAIGRAAEVALDEQGELTGEITVEFKGSEALERRLQALETDDAGKTKMLEDEVQQWLPNGAIIKLKTSSGWDTPATPLTARFSISVPTFGSLAGKRLLIARELFQLQQANAFKQQDRKFPVYFPYAFEEDDKISVRVPRAFPWKAFPRSRAPISGLPDTSVLAGLRAASFSPSGSSSSMVFSSAPTSIPRSETSSAKSSQATSSRLSCREVPSMRRIATNIAFFLIVAIMCPAWAVAATPDWLRSLAQQPQKKYADDVDAVILLDEGETTVRDNADIIKHGRLVYRILRPEGKEYAVFARHFDNETKINYLHGWSITAKGQEYEAKDKDAFERSVSTYEVFSDVKQKILALPGADVGTVVGFEYEQRWRPFVFQEYWSVQNMIPVELSRFTLRLPERWEFRADWVNHPQQDPVEQNGGFVWEVRDVPRIEKERNAPAEPALASAIVVTFFSDKIKGQTFRSWSGVGSFESQITAGTREASPALQQKVQELAPPSLSLIERINALARFAQRDVRYAAIEIGVGGLRPHTAAETFAHRYGDCKDKATLLMTMLAQIGVKSFYLPIHTQRGVVNDKTPPNETFNHAILAIQLPAGSFTKPLPAVYEHSKLGHLLIFDPTNDMVPLGQLPYYEQDSFALLVTDDGGELIHLPVSTPEANLLKRTAKVKLLPDGSLQGEVEEIASGYRAMIYREYWKDATEKDRKKVLERILGASLGNFQLENIRVTNADDLEKDVILNYKFSAERYAKNAGPLLLVRPRVVGEYAGALDASKPRHYGYEMRAPFASTETVEITLPEGYKVDELPEPAKASVSFAEYHSKIEDGGAVLRYTREYKVDTTLVPVEKIDQLKQVFGAINADEKSMAILKKTN